LSDATVRVVGASAETSGLGAAQHLPWTLDSEVEALQGLSVGLMPLDKTEWARGKCALKALQYMACGVPCIATPFGAVCDMIEDGVNGVFADTEREWRDAIERLRDPALRRRLGEAARATVEERYSLRYAAPRLESHLRSVAA
jgi:glycosyltransferase involved in cell wall biosynthesis